MSTDDTATGYGSISIALHWLAAIAVVGLLGLGLVFEDMPRGPDRLFLQNLHLSIGMAMLALFAARIAWRIAKGFPAAAEGRPWEQRAARATHILLIAAIAVLAS